MDIAMTHDTARAVPSCHDFPITPNVDYMIPSRLNAFDALGRAMGTKKSLKEQIRDAKAIIDLPLDPKLYPKIQGPDKRKRLELYRRQILGLPRVLQHLRRGGNNFGR
ncbi:hypothetical protein N658DRAFT_489217 [Parathielavia hyrcaniae]|uniref:Uncharacterized protein n=1 Tax=Parathielavia hyrcaniae TaxID=113614 RepID=A0AAN6PT33_9PEZI|nr:hypothetical protein N658DRAFT_489217 [Parathielavia hyrcaniae]